MKNRFLLKNKKFHRAISVVVIAILFAAVPFGAYDGAGRLSVYADTKDDLKDAEDELEETLAQIDQLQEKAERTEEDLRYASSILQTLMAKQAELEVEMDALQVEIDQNNIDLANAEETLDKEYESMKLRIQFMYENNASNSVWSSVLSSESFADMLSRIEYISEVHNADRALMAKYEESLNLVTELGIQLADNMSELIAMQADYRDQQAAMEVTVAMLEERAAEYEDLIAQANRQKAETEQNISDLEEKIRQEEAAAAHQSAETYEGGGTGASGFGSADYLTSGTEDPAFTGTVTGEELVAYARQFEGNPYVWGGNSLTEGCDCSGFVHLIYAHFGYGTPRYSQAFKNVGQPVSFDNIKPGDIVVYPGHVAIYAGGGVIVEAQSTRAGITCGRSVQCHEILAIRRLL